MIPDRQAARREVEANYRTQLRNEVEGKKSRVMSKDYQPQKSSFSLIDNIEREADQRRKAQEQYYVQLREQRENEKRKKAEEEARRRQMDYEEEAKITRDIEVQNQRYQQEIKKEKKKSGEGFKEATKIQKGAENGVQVSKASRVPSQVVEPAKNTRIKPLTPLPIFRSQPLAQQSPPYRLQSYAPVRKKFSDNYYQELIGHRRQLEEEASQITQFNKILQAEKYRKHQTRGLDELRSLFSALETKNSEYMGGFLPVRRLYSEQALEQPIEPLKSSTWKIRLDENRKLD